MKGEYHRIYACRTVIKSGIFTAYPVFFFFFLFSPHFVNAMKKMGQKCGMVKLQASEPIHRHRVEYEQV